MELGRVENARTAVAMRCRSQFLGRRTRIAVALAWDWRSRTVSLLEHRRQFDEQRVTASAACWATIEGTPTTIWGTIHAPYLAHRILADPGGDASGCGRSAAEHHRRCAGRARPAAGECEAGRGPQARRGD